MIAWEGEKTLTFTVEDALMSPMGLAVLTSAGLVNHSNDNIAQVHVTFEKVIPEVKTGQTEPQIEITLSDLQEETGLVTAKSFTLCEKLGCYGVITGGSGKETDFVTLKVNSAVVTGDTAGTTGIIIADPDGDTPSLAGDDYVGKTIIVDCYIEMTNSIQTITIGPEDFGGYFYVEAQTLFRDEATGKDLAANVIFPKVKIQSGFTFTMAASGDPSTFNFVMDAFPGYAVDRCDKKTMCDIQIISFDGGTDDECAQCDLEGEVTDTPSFKLLTVDKSNKVGTSHVPAGFPYSEGYIINQGKSTVTTKHEDDTQVISVAVNGGVESLETWTSTDPGQAAFGNKPWIAIDVNTGLDDITKVSYNGSALTSADVEDAAAWGLGAGHFILWIKADDVQATPKTFTLAADGQTEINVKVEIQ